MLTKQYFREDLLEVSTCNWLEQNNIYYIDTVISTDDTGIRTVQHINSSTVD